MKLKACHFKNLPYPKNYYFNWLFVDLDVSTCIVELNSKLLIINPIKTPKPPEAIVIIAHLSISYELYKNTIFSENVQLSSNSFVKRKLSAL